MLRRIIIDTNNTNYNPQKYPWNEELWNIIVPNLILIEHEDGIAYRGTDLEEDLVKRQFSHSNGHCITFKGNCGYISAAEFSNLWFEDNFLKKYDKNYYQIYLSELLEQISEIENINWRNNG